MLRIRRDQVSDAKIIYHIMNSSQIFPRTLKHKSREEAIEKIKEYLSMKERQFYLAIKGKKVVGYTSFAPIGLYPDLDRLPSFVNKIRYCMSSGLVVEPKFRNKGIAK